MRIAALADSALIAHKLAGFRVAVHAAPALIASHGRPEHPSELAHLPCIVDTNLRSRANWPFMDKGARLSVPVGGRVEVNSPLAAAAAARAGLGFCRGPWQVVGDDIEAGRLATVLDDYEIDNLGVYLVYPHRDRMPAKLRAFIDHLAAWHEAERKTGRAG